jgi:hypothetical protein
LDFASAVFLLRHWEAHHLQGRHEPGKVYQLIGRFSEDIDLILDWRLLGLDIPKPGDFASRNQQNRMLKQLEKYSLEFLSRDFFPRIGELLAPVCKCEADVENKHGLRIIYPGIFTVHI